MCGRACSVQVLMRLAGYMGSEYLPLAARTFPAWRRLVQGHERAVHKPKGQCFATSLVRAVHAAIQFHHTQQFGQGARSRTVIALSRVRPPPCVLHALLQPLPFSDGTSAAATLACTESCAPPNPFQLGFPFNCSQPSSDISAHSRRRAAKTCPAGRLQAPPHPRPSSCRPSACSCCCGTACARCTS